jgi:tRNA pseudouridine38-40 synthase
MQRNPGCPTIEAELESALVKAGAISEQNAGSFMKVGLNLQTYNKNSYDSFKKVILLDLWQMQNMMRARGGVGQGRSHIRAEYRQLHEGTAANRLY